MEKFESRLCFNFSNGVEVFKYDEWEYYNKFQNGCYKDKNNKEEIGFKAIDFLVCKHDESWLLEVKNYCKSELQRKKDENKQPLTSSQLIEEVAKKFRDSLTGLAAAKYYAEKQEEKEAAIKFFATKKAHLILHLEQDESFDYIFDPADIASKLSKKLSALGSPMICNSQTIGELPWSVKIAFNNFNKIHKDTKIKDTKMLNLYNTLTRQKEAFSPIDPKNVRMYVCGMTVYDYCHLGHARVMVVFDMIARWLRECGYPLTYVRNITDIDDKIIARAAENGETIGDLTARFIAAMHEDADALGVLRPDLEPKATENIAEMIAMIENLIARGKAYPAANGDVYYAVREFAAYGQLSGKSLDDLRAGERVEVDGFKRDPLDFVLWKAAKAGEPAWESPWGQGRPGWHIECSAMSEKLFGDTFDIHGGGADLQFPHHENEIAQSVGASGHICGHNHATTHHGKPVASHVKYWLHNGFIRVDGEKMSKSLGNFFTIRDVLKQYDPEVVRFFILRAHYRSPLNYSDAHLDDAKGALARLYTALKNTPPAGFALSETANDYTRRFYAAMNDDFGTVEAVAVLFELAGEVNKTRDAALAGCLKALGGIIGLLQRDPTEFLQGGTVSDGLSNEEIENLIARRKQARADKNWAESDRIRDLLTAQNIMLEDSAGVTTWRRG